MEFPGTVSMRFVIGTDNSCCAWRDGRSTTVEAPAEWKAGVCLFVPAPGSMERNSKAKEEVG